MNIKIHTSLVLALCTGTGVALGAFLMHRSRQIDDDLRRVGPTSVTMRNVELLSESLGQWLTTNDLLLQKDQTFMVTPSMQQAERLRKLVAEVAVTELVGNQGAELGRLLADLDAVRDCVRQARDLRGDDRPARLAAIAEAADARSHQLVARLGELERTLRRRADYLTADLAEQRGVLHLLAWIAGGLYLSVIWLSWLWIVHKMVVPIEDLSRAAERAAEDEREFRLALAGPDEVRKMAQNFGRFVGKLQDAKAHTEEQVRQRTVELVHANQAKSQFLATMSHELRTPLNGIINMNELMLDTHLDAEQAGFARTAKNAAEALLALINDVLDFSKIEARKLELEAIEFDPRGLLDTALEILAGVAESKGLELQAVVAPEVPSMLRGDPMRLRQVVINLLNNALKFTAAGSVSVHVSLAEAGPAQSMLRFEVRDTGIGIPPERRTALFQAFEQVDATTTRKYGGTGLGLAICKELAELMGGAIGVDSELGVGSTFWFTARFGTVATPAPAALDLVGAQVVLLSRRPLLVARVTAQLRYLGVAADDCLAVAETSALSPPAGRRRLVLVDPYGGGDAPFAAVHAARQTVGVDAARVAVLDHWLRHWPARLGPAPQDVIRIVEPTRLEQVRAWLLGELVAAAPAAAPAPAVPASVVAPGPIDDRVSQNRARILVAEDNEVNLRVIRAVLERADYTVTVAENGERALEVFRREPFDLVLMDCQMPVMDGIEATRKIRSLEVERSPSSSLPRHVPIVALTANARDEVQKQCLDAGMNRFMGKPFRPEALLATIDELLRPQDATGESAGVDASLGPRVLVADDGAINLRVAQTVLARAGYEVVTVENGQQAVDFVVTTPVALVLMDCEMPVLDGLAAASRIRQLEAQRGLAPGGPARLPIVALTGHTQASARDAALAAGMDRFVTKPFRPKELLAVVTELAGPGRFERAGCEAGANGLRA